MPSVRHQLLAWGVPILRKSRDLDTEALERARIERWHAGDDFRSTALPTGAVRRFERRFAVERVEGAVATYVLTVRGTAPTRTVVYVHGGGFVSGIDAFHVRYAARLAAALGVRVVIPDYPLAPEHTWRDSHSALVALTQRWLTDARASPDGVVLAGDSAGGGLALAVALSVRDAGGPQPSHLLLHAPWVDLTTSTPETDAVTLDDPWLFIGKLKAYARWWAGSADDLARPEVSPALADLSGLPPALMFCGTRDTLMPGCRLLARRALDAGWALDYVEEPGLIHVYPLLPAIPEAARAWRRTQEFLG